MTRTCSICRTEFTPWLGKQRTCSTPCSEELARRSQARRDRRKRERRGTAVYGSEHRKRRAEWQKVVDRGEAYCWRPDCRRHLPPGCTWHLGHLDDRSGYGGPECPPCNLRHAAIKGNRMRAQQGRYASSQPRIAR